MTGSINPVRSGGKKKLLILTDWFWPGYKAGGPIQSCINICRALNDQFDIYVLTTDTDHASKEPYPDLPAGTWVFNEELKVHICYLKKNGISTAQIKTYATAVKANTVYLNHLFSPLFVVYPIWLFITGQLPSKLVVCPRGALYDSALSLKKYKKMPLLWLYRMAGIQKKIFFHATNDREKAAIEKYFPGSKITVADNLPDMNQGPFIPLAKTAGEIKCIFISRIVPIKNLSFLLQALKNVTAQVQLTIAGPAEDKAYFDECLQMTASLPVNIKTEYIGAVANTGIKALIQQHHLFILPTKGENFGHSIIEALFAGRPVLISDQTPWNNLETANAGWALSIDRSGNFTTVIEKVASLTDDQYRQYALGAWNFAKQYAEKNDALRTYELLFA